ncbi:MAG TPA: efflux RND transporter periplasmic adaptor subunit [Vicinamibacterales bacterium]|nr:efflux RND transporter periplasmic adaptor subunit [Vicinamibacterales bacterium]
MKRAIIVVVLLAVVGGGVGAWYSNRNKTQIQVNTSPLSRGDIVDTVGATGTLQAVTTVQVGSQVSGNIQWLGADFNSIVKKGQVIARLDPSLFDAQHNQVQANLVQARANLTKSRSELDRARVQLTDAQQKYARAKELASQQLLPASELDAAKIAVDSATASLASQQATVQQVQAAVTQSEASVNQSQVNRDHTVILAPIDGIVTQRSVDVGQTVAASMSAPTLFVIAADLTEMQVNANIDEADVGRIRPGQQVTFRVDAYPTDNFVGTVTQIRLQPVVVQNVTTYGTVITVPNRDLKLKPGMTANVKIEIAKRTNALRIPNTALRFRPTADVFAALNQEVPPDLTMTAGGGRGGRGGGGGFGRGGGGGSGPGSLPAAQGNATPQSPRNTSANAPAGSEGRGPRPPSASARPQSDELRRDPAAANAGRGGGGGGRGGGGGFGRGGDRAGAGFGREGGQARMLERFKTMSPEEQQQFLARMKERGGDTTAFEAARPRPAAKGAAKSATPQASTIDALFAPLPVVESRGRAWLYIDKQLKAVTLRLGISDGTYTEVLSEDLQETSEVVTGVTGLASTRGTPTQGGTGNPLMPGRGGPGGPGRGGRG